jgi:hypothetical protein
MDRERIFTARLQRQPDGTVRATYRGVLNPSAPRTEVGSEGPHILSDSHLGADEQSVRAFVEAFAKNQGYDRVRWET